jgi:hypothetical protein
MLGDPVRGASMNRCAFTLATSLMSRGLHELITKWEKGNQTERAAAVELHGLQKKQTALTEFLPLLLRLESSQVLSHDAVFCITSDLVEECARIAAEEAIGRLEDDEDTNRDLRCELHRELQQVIDVFCSQHSLPPRTVEMVLHDLIEEGSWKETAVPYDKVRDAKVAELFPQLLQQLGLIEMANLYQGNPDAFRRRKEAGERVLIGRTYEEDLQGGLGSSFSPRI